MSFIGLSIFCCVPKSYPHGPFSHVEKLFCKKGAFTFTGRRTNADVKQRKHTIMRRKTGYFNLNLMDYSNIYYQLPLFTQPEIDYESCTRLYSCNEHIT